MSTHVPHRETVDRAAVQLHVLLVTWTPSESRTQTLLSALCPFLRRAGHSVLVCVPPGSLDPELAAKADDAGIEYVFVPPHPHTPFSPLRGWAVMWRQFKPNLVHLFPDVPPSIALNVVRAAQSKLRRRIPVIVQVDAGVDQVIAGEWQSHAHAHAAEGRGRNQQVMVALLRKATQIACTDSHSLWACREVLRLPAFRCSVIGNADPYSPSELVEALYDEALYAREAGGSAGALVGETNTKRNIETVVTHLYHIYEGVHLREG